MAGSLASKLGAALAAALGLYPAATAALLPSTAIWFWTVYALLAIGIACMTEDDR